MDYKIRISPIAKANIKEAVSYYKKEASLKVAQNFVKDYELALQKVKQNPFFQIYYKNFRGLPLKKFPYIILKLTKMKAPLFPEELSFFYFS